MNFFNVPASSVSLYFCNNLLSYEIIYLFLHNKCQTSLNLYSLKKDNILMSFFIFKGSIQNVCP